MTAQNTNTPLRGNCYKAAAMRKSLHSLKNSWPNVDDALKDITQIYPELKGLLRAARGEVPGLPPMAKDDLANLERAVAAMENDGAILRPLMAARAEADGSISIPFTKEAEEVFKSWAGGLDPNDEADTIRWLENGATEAGK
jgi:hypothetical protein